MKTKIEDISDLIKKGLTTTKKFGNLNIMKTSKKAFFENDYTDLRLINYRSVVYNDDNEIISLGFSKLFNYEELDFVQRQTYSDKEIVAVEKINGFMFCISCYTENSEQKILYHTKGSLENEYIEWAKGYLSHLNPHNLISNCTYIFEICHPNDPHIVTEEPGAYLIGIRRHVPSSTPLLEHTVDLEAYSLALKRPKWFKTTLSALLSEYILHKNEGYIIREANGYEKPLFKLKTPYYKYLKIIARGKSKNALNRGLEASENYPILKRLHSFIQFAHPLIFQMEEQERLKILKETYVSLEIAWNSKNNLKTLYMIRGLPGSGKSTLAKQLLNLPNAQMFEADSFFIDENGNYIFNKELLHRAHQECQKNVLKALVNKVDNIIISNTSTTEKELSFYLEAAKLYNYKIHSIILENRHGGKSIHEVPEETILKMRERFSVKLT